MKIEISVRNVVKKFDEFLALHNINLDIYDGELHVLLGPSGCGKTTLLRLIAGFDQVTDGDIIHDGVPVKEPGSQRGFVFQEGTHFQWRTVLRNIEFGLEIQGVTKEERLETSKKYLNLVGLTGFANYYPSQISGGMKQKMVLATVLANDPAVLLMDEPFGALDAQTRTYMQGELLRIWGETKKTIIFVTHSIREALLIATRISLFKTNPGEIAKIYDIDKELNTKNVDRDSSDKDLVDLEASIYVKMRHEEF